MGLILGVHTAFSDRSSALLTVQTLTTELDSLYSQAEKIETSSKTFGNDRSKALKLGELREAIRVTEDAKSCATREYERIKVFLLYFYIFLFSLFKPANDHNPIY